jgi:hypothetical protein
MSFGIIFFGDTNPGIVPASGGGTTNFLRADQTWDAAGGGSLPALADRHIYVASGANNPVDYPLLTVYTVSLGPVIQAVNNAGNMAVIGSSAAIATQAGADISINGGDGNTSGGGGTAFLVGGAGGTTGAGGAAWISGGNGGHNGGKGGDIVMVTGLPNSFGNTAAGGDCLIQLSAGQAGGRGGRLVISGLPTSNAGLATGDVWVDTTGGNNILKIV